MQGYIGEGESDIDQASEISLSVGGEERCIY